MLLSGMPSRNRHGVWSLSCNGLPILFQYAALVNERASTAFPPSVSCASGSLGPPLNAPNAPNPPPQGADLHHDDC